MNQDKVQLFEDQPIRTAWVEEEEEWYFSVVDVVQILTEQPDLDGARNYWKVLKNRLKEEGKRIILYTEGKRIIGLIAARKMLLPEAETSITRLRENDIELLFLTNGTEEEAVYLSKKHGSLCA